MAEVLGPSLLMDKALPIGIDYTRLKEWSFQDGVTYEQVATMLSNAIGTVNESLVAKWGWLFSLTEEISFEYANGGAVTPMPERTDDVRPKPVKGTLIGHMTESHMYGDAIAGSRDYWKRARSKRVLNDIKTIVLRGIWRFEIELLGRFFNSDEIAVGAQGYNVPFVHSTGGAVDYAPMAFEGIAHTTSHDHFIGYNASTPKTMADVLNGLAAELAHHGHKAPYTALVSRTDADAGLFNALTKFVNYVQIPGLIIGGSTSTPGFMVQAEQDFNSFGEFQSGSGIVKLIANSRIPTGYVGMTKSYGNLDSRNALSVYTFPGDGFGMRVVPQTVAYQEVPISQIDIDFEFGVSVGEDRTNGAVGLLVAGGSYTDATIQ